MLRPLVLFLAAITAVVHAREVEYIPNKSDRIVSSRYFVFIEVMNIRCFFIAFASKNNKPFVFNKQAELSRDIHYL